MELLQMQYFREIARSGHLSRTAEKLHIAQPSLSQMLKRLENEIGLPLFNRVGKRLVLNDSGKIFLKYVDEIFCALDNAKLELENDQQQKQKTVALHICSASMCLPKIIQRIHKADPDIRLQIFQNEVSEKTTYPSLYLTSSPDCRKNSLFCEVLLKEKIKAALPKEHPLAKKQCLTWDEIKEEPFFSLAPESNLSVIIRSFCEAKGLTLNISTSVETPAMLRELLRLKLGVAFVPEYTWQGFAEDSMVLKSVVDLQMERYLLLSWPENVCQTLAWKTCKSTITEYFQEKYNQIL